MMTGLTLSRPSWLVAVVMACWAVHDSTQLSLNSPALHGPNSTTYGLDPEVFNDSEEDVEDEIRRGKRFETFEEGKKWPKRIIPYKFGQTDPKNKKDIVAGMAFYEYLTPIRFQEFDSSQTSYLGHTGFIHFTTTWGRGWSLLGFYNSARGQHLDCPRQRTCVHEMGHALGFQHEQYHPERDQWIAINIPKVQYELGSWKTLGWKNMGKTHFDYSSFMLYPPSFNTEYDVLFPEQFPFEQHPFYMFKELCVNYECDKAPQCAGKQMSCANEGYVSVVEGECSCVCLPYLDPATGCTTVIGNGKGKWPSGMFSLLEHKDGCPSGYFGEGTVTHWATGDNRMVSPDFKGTLSGQKAVLNFCTKTADSQEGMWPLGSYCFFKKGSCPNQRGVTEGKIEMVGDYTNYKDNTYTGSLPSGKTGLDSTLEYCCIHTGFTYIPMNLPNDKPFILLVRNRQKCQQVTGMSSRMEKFGLYSPRIFGDASWEYDGRTALIYYCVYEPLDRQCGDIVELGPSKTSVTIESDKSNPSNRECDWLFKIAPGNKGKLVMTFEDFYVPCSEYVEVQYTMVGQKGRHLCDDLDSKTPVMVKDLSMQSLYDKMRVHYRSLDNTKAHFKATIRYVPDDELCYDATRNGATYRGDVSYTKDFEPCLPWSEVTQCLKTPNSLGFPLANLVGNKCRNPDDSFYPWCYTKLDGCKRNFCDVCQLEKPYDTADDCADRKSRGLCHTNTVDCAATCGLIKQGPAKNARPITCGQPGAVSGGDLQGSSKSSYNSGDSVTYKCRKSGNTISRSCQGDGKWSTANTACLPCPEGYTHFRQGCYKFVYKFMIYSDAEDYCKKAGSELALPRNQGENDFFAALRYPLNAIWMGAKYQNKQFVTPSGDAVKWFNWRFYDVPHPEKCVYMREDTMWKDNNACDWEMNFICHIPVTDNEPECKDFLDNCPSLVKAEKDSNCDLKPGLETYCRYTCGKCPTDCNNDVQLSQTNREYTINADRSTSSHRYCTWNVKAPSKEGRIVLQFDEFDIPSDGDECQDGVEVRSDVYGLPYSRFCNAGYNKTVILEQDTMLVRFIAPEVSNSRFKAHVKWIPDEDMCYHAADKGWSYAGRVNYTSTFEACLPWTDVLHCVNNTLWNGNSLENLDENFCRNPRPEEQHERPYCYTADCMKKDCDVCHLENPSDNSTDCQSFKNAGKCLLDPYGAATKCAETCRAELVKDTVKVSQVSCSSPSQLSDGSLVSTKKSNYMVGDKAMYKCNTRNFYVKRTCLSSGTWSTAHSACLDCPFGFIPYKDQCYKYFPIYTDKDGANDHCQKMGGVVANPKNDDQNKFISSIREGERIWLGGTKSTSMFKWNDGTSVVLRNWKLAKKQFKYRDNCMVLERDTQWTDDWCRNKLFHFVCQVQPQDEEKVCVDYLDACPDLVQAIPDGDCTEYPSLQLDCRATCGLCKSDCKKNIQVTSTNQTNDISSNGGFCTWHFQGDGKPGRFIVTIDKFSMKSPDALTMTLSRTDGYLHKYSEREYQKVTYVDADHLTLAFTGKANTDSTFEATVRYVKDVDMCYNVRDNGTSYVGQVSFSKTYHKCLPWTQTGYCGHSPIKNGDFLDNLDGNYCRNPDGSGQPWCYSSGCHKEICDVCHLEKLEDTGDDCADRKRQGKCTKDSIDCAKTCQLDKDVTRVSNIRCGSPSQVPGGQLQGSGKSQYNVGDVVTYKCSRSSFPVTRMCLSSGEWSVANTACLACPLDSYEFHGNCYKYIENGLNYTDSEKLCKEYGATLAAPRSFEESTFMLSLRATGHNARKHLWVGAQRNKEQMKYFYEDGNPVTYTKWSERKQVKDRQDCIQLENGGAWRDDWCHDKNFSIVCQQKAFEQPDCIDFVDDCPHRLSLTHKKMCDPDSRLETLCRKTCGLCPKDCDHTVELSSSVPSYELSHDRRKNSSRYCTWQFKVTPGKQGRFVIQFDDFYVSDSSRTCVDMVEVKDSIYGSPLKYYCNRNKNKEIEIMGDSLFVRFRSISNSHSHIKAQVTWIDDDSMCYNVKDNGRSYSGEVNYSKTFQPCLPWAQMQHCRDHPLQEGTGNLISHLQGNACRNPDNSDRPWCYTQSCNRESCDVCHLETPHDNDNNCDGFKKAGRCTSDPALAIQHCALTCKAVPTTQTTFRAIDVTCGAPKQVPGAELTTRVQASYHVGDEATYKCPRSTSTVTSVCLTSGEWSDANTPCLSCPGGWTQFGDKCYRFIHQFLEYVDAEAECKKLSAIVAPAKTKAINDFFKTIKDSGRMWIGAKKDKNSNKFYWSDGDEMTWSNWNFPTKAADKRDECILANWNWRDDWCHDKYFPFVCQLDTDDNPDCVDFMDSCSDYVQHKNNQCNSILNKYCRKACGLCNQ